MISLGQNGVKKDWTLFFNTLFWNLNFWDNVSTLAGEVDKPQKIFPLALFVAVIFTCLSYFIPLFEVIGAVSVNQSEWESGFHATAAEMIAGRWLKYWIEVGATLSAIGLFEAQLSSTAFQLLGMADLGFLPNFFAKRNVIRICIFSLVEKEIARIEETLQDSNEAARIGDNVLNTICVLSAHNGNCYKDCLFGEWLDDCGSHWMVFPYEVLQVKEVV
ncbi:hypothetical protein GH714_027405 [Hevea brasiliensis]|uniref:Amino acid permease/ SLC12A domain-containing protein n=1 Tax=Hevea brasiliensis TaxID=3981 RepID=A0A6A6MNG8_HEVBR|nr:hypothetical protein GH714_027405 [Hevea brasiliensis]